MRILLGLPYPAVQTIEAVLIVDAEGEEYAAYSFIEGAHDGSECFLSCLSMERCTVSQIWSFTWVFSSILTVLDVNSTPTVTL